jgi:glycosidase
MPTSIVSQSVRDDFGRAATPRTRSVTVGGRTVSVATPFPSPEDWRDQWVYFLMIDRFNNPAGPPKHQPFDGEFGVFQGGTFNGVRQQLDYLRDLGVGAIWMTPVLKNCQYEDGTYHGYGIQDFLSVDPRFASDPQAAIANPALAEDELRQLVDEAHARGLYVIFDIVLNHCGNVFGYAVGGDPNASTADFNDDGYAIAWHDEQGGPGFPDFDHAPAMIPDDAAVWPEELHANRFFRRKGKGGEAGGDFESLKELVTADVSVRDVLIRSYQHAIARFDIDAFRIDTLKFIEPDFARVFGNAMREYALSIGKKNFFTFGEVFAEEETIAQFIGRNAGLVEDPIGVDASLDFPLFFRLPGVAKGLVPPSALAGMYEHRKQVEREVLTSHGEAGRYFVTFLDNHDMGQRFYFSAPNSPHRFDDQLTLGLACLMSLQGIPCLYYGTEQGLHGNGGRDLSVREALWGKGPNAFDRTHPFYQAIARVAGVRAGQPALRYGRQYFRPVSGDGVHFGVSPFSGGVLAFSRVLNDQEVLVIANTDTQAGFQGEVIIDAALNGPQADYDLLFSNHGQPGLPGRTLTKAAASVEIHEVSGAVTDGPARTLPVTLQPMEVQILRKAG